MAMKILERAQPGRRKRERWRRQNMWFWAWMLVLAGFYGNQTPSHAGESMGLLLALTKSS